MARDAAACELHPRPTDASGEIERFGQTAGEMDAEVRIVKREGDLGAVEGPGPSIKHRGPPGEQVEVRGGCPQGRFPGRLVDGRLAEGSGRDDGLEISLVGLRRVIALQRRVAIGIGSMHRPSSSASATA